MIRTADFFYDNGELLENLMRILAKEKDLCYDDCTIKIYKFIVAVEVMQEEKAAMINFKYVKVPLWRKMGIYMSVRKVAVSFKPLTQDELALADAMKVFIERVESKDRSIFYFEDYIQKELQEPGFIELLENFCSKSMESTELSEIA